MALLITSFVAGILTIFAPCILPILPVIVGRSITDPTLNIRRLLVIILSLGVSIILFTLLLKASTLLVDIPQDFWRWFSGGIVLIFGLITFFPDLWGRISLTGVINRRSNESLSSGYQKDSVWGDVVVGVSLGPIFSTTSPTYLVILATVLPVSLSKGILYLIAYTSGLCLALFLVSIIGQKLVYKLGMISNPQGRFKKFIGVIFIIVGIFIIFGYSEKVQTKLTESGFFDVAKIEEKLLNK